MNRSVIIIVLLAVAGFSALRGRDAAPGPNPTPVPTSTAQIAEWVHRERARRQAEVYNELADAVESGRYTQAADLGRDTVTRIAEIEQGVGKPLSEDAAAKLPTGDIESPAAVAEWYRDVAKGFAKVAK